MWDIVLANDNDFALNQVAPIVPIYASGIEYRVFKVGRPTVWSKVGLMGTMHWCIEFQWKLEWHISSQKNPNNGGLTGLEPAASRKTTQPNSDDGPLQIVHNRLPINSLIL